MAYRSSSGDNDGCLIAIAGIAFLNWNFTFLENPEFNIQGVLLIIIWLIIFYFIFYEKIDGSINSYKLKIKKCEHGVKGAVLNSDLCSKCTQTKISKKFIIEEIRLRNAKKHKLIEKRNKLLRNNEKLIQQKLNTEIDFLRNMDPFEFENQVARMFKGLGYSAKVTSKTNDEGKDIILNKNGETIYVECKRFSKDNKVSRPMIQKLYGVMVADNVKKGIVVTTTDFTKESIEFANKMNGNIRLINEKEIVKLFKETSNIKNSKLNYFQICDHNLDNSDIYSGNLNQLSLSELKNYLEKYSHPCGESIGFSLEKENENCTKNHVIINHGKVYYENLLKGENNFNKICPRCNGQLIKKKQTARDRRYFLGCSNYPKCTFTKSIR